MADARAVPCNIFGWPRVVALLPDQKMIFAYLWFNRFANSAGCYMLPTAPAAADLSFSEAALKEAFVEFQRRSLIEMDATTGEIFVVDWFRFNKFPAGARQRVLLQDVKKIESPKLRKLVEKAIENSVDIANPENSTTCAPREVKGRKEPPPTPPSLPLHLSSENQGRGGGGLEDEGELEKLIAATILARKSTGDPVNSPAGWAEYARKCAAAGDLTPLEPGRQFLEAKALTEAQLQQIKSEPPPGEEVSITNGQTPSRSDFFAGLKAKCKMPACT